MEPITIRDLKVHVHDDGDKKRPAIIFLHAFPFSHHMWTAQIEAFQETHRVLRYDYRGIGQTSASEMPVSMDLLADDLIAIQDHFQIEKSVWCGLSMGGYVALRAKELYPERVHALILADTRTEPDNDEARAKRFSQIKQIFEKGVPAFAVSFAKNVVAPETLTGKPEVMELLLKMIERNTAVGISQCLLALAARTDTALALSKDPVPTLLMVGEKDTLTPAERAEAMQRLCPSAKLVRIPGAGHMSNLENPLAFNLAVREFLQSL